MDSQTCATMLRTNQELASRGLRVLAVAERVIPEGTVCIDSSNLETSLTLLGLVAMSDTLRPDIAKSIESCKKAGIQVIMLTGDQIHTAESVAKSIGIEQVMARVTPEMKLAVVQDLRTQGHVVAMTGDGVNDAPALKQSNIGVAMGLSGSDLARDASDLVITDDNFATIVAAIEEGRAIYRNIKRAVAYLLTASMCSVLVVAIGVLANRELLLNPLQLLWLNLIMHVFPGIGLVMQRDTQDAMLMPPRDPKQPLLTSATVWSIVVRSALISIGVSLAPSLAHHGTRGGDDSSICFAVASIALLLQSWAWLWDRSVRSGNAAFDFNTLFNKPMFAVTLIGFACVAAALSDAAFGYDRLAGIAGGDSSNVYSVTRPEPIQYRHSSKRTSFTAASVFYTMPQ
jgi:Ca2+-transporting ATPase